MGNRVKQYLGNTYKIFENKKLPFANQYVPTDEAMQKEQDYLRYSIYTKKQ